MSNPTQLPNSGYSEIQGVKYTAFGDLKKGDEFIRVGGYPVLLSDVDGERHDDGRFTPAYRKTTQHKGGGRQSIRRMDLMPGGWLTEVDLSLPEQDCGYICDAPLIACNKGEPDYHDCPEFQKAQSRPEAAHTPGPWEYSQAPGGPQWIASGSLDIAMVLATDPQTREVLPAIANAQVMAAAPELLESCESLLALVDALGEKVDWGASFLDADTVRLLNEVPLSARKVAAKAKGQQQ